MGDLLFILANGGVGETATFKSVPYFLAQSFPAVGVYGDRSLICVGEGKFTL